MMPVNKNRTSRRGSAQQNKEDGTHKNPAENKVPREWRERQDGRWPQKGIDSLKIKPNDAEIFDQGLQSEIAGAHEAIGSGKSKMDALNAELKEPEAKYDGVSRDLRGRTNTAEVDEKDRNEQILSLQLNPIQAEWDNWEKKMSKEWEVDVRRFNHECLLQEHSQIEALNADLKEPEAKYDGASKDLGGGTNTAEVEMKDRNEQIASLQQSFAPAEWDNWEKELTKQEERHKEELAQQKESFELKLSEQLEALRRDLFEREDKLNKWLACLEDNLNLQLEEREELGERHKEELAQQESFELKLSKQNEALRKDLSEREDKLNHWLAYLEDNLNLHLEELEHQEQRHKEELAQQMESFKLKLSEQLESFKLKLSEQLEALRKNLSEREKKLNKQLARLKDNLSHQLGEQEERHREELAQQKKSFELNLLKQQEALRNETKKKGFWNRLFHQKE